ncbi:MAG: TonB-dependent receptor domain-containing protein [Elainellaceae cyanobacterium]
MNLVVKQHYLHWIPCSSGLMLCLSGFLFLSSTSSWASEASELETTETPIEVLQTDGINAEDETGSASALRSTPMLLSEFEQPATTMEEWMAQIAQARVTITGIQVEETEAGLQVVLETDGGDLPTPNTRMVGNALIAEIPNAVLDLPEGEPFEQFGPAAGIALLSVTNEPDGGVRISITGTDAPPQAQISTEAGNFVLSLVPGVAATADAEDDAIQVVVTATRTEEEISDVPRSVTIVTREQIEEQTNLTTNLADILGQTVPGLGPPTQSVDTFPQTLRGREVQILIDGVPISTNQFSAFDSALRSIAPSAIERIEVVRGPSAAFGEGATGGVINIITRQPEETLTQTIETRVNSRGDFADDGFGTYVGYGMSGTDDSVDLTFNISWETFGFAFDGAGDQIPGDGHSVENGRSINLLGKLGVDIDEHQRLQFSINYFDEDSEAEFINDPNVDDDPDADKARALEVDLDCIDVECGDGRRNTTLSLNYSHDNLFGSQLRLQGFYRDTYDLNGVPFEDFRNPGTFLLGQQESERFGGRLEVETPFSETFNLLWGVDYSNEEASQPYQVLDDEFVNSGFRVARLDEEVFFTPPYTVENLGLFAQGQWDVKPRWRFSGGIRYENIGVSADDYTLRLFQFQNDPVDIEGGSINADDVVFNIGTVYDMTDELNVFASFAQGFGVPDFGRLLRRPPDGFRSLEDDLEFTAPQKVNNYELGFRGQWNTIQFSLAGFYNESDLGVSLIRTAQTVEVARAPERIYGVEATADWQPSPTWQLGGLISWHEGENDLDEDGDFAPLRSSQIQPLKITAYVENETLPGWRNRFQALFVGGRDRAFDPDEGPDFAPVESYFVLDYISSIDLGPGSLQIGVHNLLDELYFPIESQIFAPFSPEFKIAAPGRTISIGYRVTF